VKVTADNKRRVVLPTARPGDLFEVSISGEGRFTLTKLEPVTEQNTPVHFEKRDGFTVGVSQKPITQESIRAALDDFP